MINLVDSNPFETSVMNRELHVLPPIIKYVERRGFLYIVLDTAYPEWCKIGKTVNLASRLTGYNKDRPIATAFFSVVSLPFKDATSVESIILEQMYKTINSSSKSKEWFDIKHYTTLVDWIRRAERESEIIKNTKQEEIINGNE